MKTFLKILYVILQCSWGILQTLLGFLFFLLNLNCKHSFFHGAIVTKWKGKSSISLGLFVFVTGHPYFYEKLKDEYSEEELSSRLLVHEYGHTIQSLILGIFYLFIMGIPSTVWGFSKGLHQKRKNKNISYFSFFTESWANTLGEKITKQKSMELLLID